MRFVLGIVVLLVSSGCAAPPATKTIASPTAPTPPLPPLAAQNLAASSPPSSSSSFGCFVAQPQPMDSDQIDTWYRMRGANPPQDLEVKNCIPTRVGYEEVLHCRVLTHRTATHARTIVVTREVVRAIRHNHVEAVLDVPVEAAVLAKPPNRPIVWLASFIGTERATILDSQKGCASSQADLARALEDATSKKDQPAIAEAKLAEQVRTEICGSTGEYTLMTAIFVRQ